MAHEITLPALVVLVGPSGAGKTTWARKRFVERSIVSSDELRGRVGLHDYDQKASSDAFEVLEGIVEARLRRRLTTVVDTLGLDPASRRRWIEMAHLAGLPAVAVHFDTPAGECRSRNKQRARPVPARVLTKQIQRYADPGGDTRRRRLRCGLRGVRGRTGGESIHRRRSKSCGSGRGEIRLGSTSACRSRRSSSRVGRPPPAPRCATSPSRPSGPASPHSS